VVRVAPEPQACEGIRRVSSAIVVRAVASTYWPYRSQQDSSTKTVSSGK
jgi:hypothetical protein